MIARRVRATALITLPAACGAAVYLQIPGRSELGQLHQVDSGQPASRFRQHARIRHSVQRRDAAWLPILPALVRCDEVAAGAIDHALRFTVPQTQRGYIHPATHYAGESMDPNLPPMGMRVRLKASYDISRFNRVSRVFLTAMKRYGMFVADGGSGSRYFQGQGGPQESCWNDGQLDRLKSVPGTAFEVVATGPILRIAGP